MLVFAIHQHESAMGVHDTMFSVLKFTFGSFLQFLFFFWDLFSLHSSQVCFPVHCVCAKLFQSCPTLCNPMDCSLPDSSVHGILQVRILEWVDISYSRGSPQPRDLTCVSYVSCLRRRILYHCPFCTVWNIIVIAALMLLLIILISVWHQMVLFSL